MYRREERFERSLWDRLDQQQLEYWSREYVALQPAVGRALYHLRLAPYPLDGDTAAAVQGIIDNVVIPWGLVDYYIEEWIYAYFLETAVRFGTALPRAEEGPPIPTLETLRSVLDGSVPEELAGGWDEGFAFECHLLRSGLQNGLLQVDEPALAGRFVLMPDLPLGTGWLCRVPLLDHEWIDRRVVELCEASALLTKEGYSRLPSFDSHSFAWHRWYPPATLWTAPQAAPHACLTDALRRVSSAVRAMPARLRLFGGREFFHIDDYAGWAGRGVPTAQVAQENREEGVVLGRWNDWVFANSADGRVDLYGPVGTPMSVHWCLREGESVRGLPDPEAAEKALAERVEALGQLYLAGQSAAASSAAAGSARAPVRASLQLRIRKALAGCALTADRLAFEVGCDRRTLYKSGGIKELLDRGVVCNDRQVGGYYLPDDPPQLPEKKI